MKNLRRPDRKSSASFPLERPDRGTGRGGTFLTPSLGKSSRRGARPSLRGAPLLWLLSTLGRLPLPRGPFEKCQPCLVPLRWGDIGLTYVARVDDFIEAAIHGGGVVQMIYKRHSSKIFLLIL